MLVYVNNHDFSETKMIYSTKSTFLVGPSTIMLQINQRITWLVNESLLKSIPPLEVLNDLKTKNP